MKNIQLRDRPLSQTLIAFNCACLLVFLITGPGCDLPGRPTVADKPVLTDKVVNFNQLYRQHCAGCHGTDGTLGPAPPLNDATFLTIVPDSMLLQVITDGRPGTPMPAFAVARGGPLTNVQIKALAAGIKPRWSSSHLSTASIPSYSIAPGGSAGNRSHGANVFARACASCHGPGGRGTEDDKQGAGPINDPAFLALISDQALRRLIITGRPDLGMPGYADTSGRPAGYQPITSADIDDLVALLALWRQGEQVTLSTEP